MVTETTLGVATTNVVADTLRHNSGGVVGFYGTAPITQQTVALSSAATTTVLRTDVDAIHAALVALGLIV